MLIPTANVASDFHLNIYIYIHTYIYIYISVHGLTAIQYSVAKILVLKMTISLSKQYSL